MKIYKICSFMLLVFSGFFLAHITQYSPVYLIILLSTVLFFYRIIETRKLHYDSISNIINVMIIYLALQGFMLNGKYSIVAIFACFTYLILEDSLPRLSDLELHRYVDIFLFFSIIMFIIELIIRIQHPIYSIESYNAYKQRGTLFYIYKYASVMFSDSNGTAIYVVTMFFLAEYMYSQYRKRKYRIEMLVLLVLLIFTFSRAAYFAVIFVIALAIISKLAGRNKKNLLLSIIIFIQVASIVFNKIRMSKDLSLLMKLDILNDGYRLFNHYNIWQKLFGVGMGNAKGMLAIFAHNIFLNYLLETGIIGLLLLIIMLITIYIHIPRARYLLIALLVVLQSSMLYSMPFMFAAFAAIKSISEKNNKNKGYGRLIRRTSHAMT